MDLTTNHYSNTPHVGKEKSPMGFGKTMLASAVGCIIAFVVLNVVTFIASVCFLVGMLSNIDTSEPVIGDDFAIEIDLTQPIFEREADELTTLLSDKGCTSIEQLLCALDNAATDNRINAIYLHLGGSNLAWAQAEELSEALQTFRETCHKPIIAYGDVYSQPEYYLATSADRIAVHPSGIIDFRGIGAEVLFYKGLLDKLGVHIELIRPTSCAYKSAGEAFTRTDMSDANREQVRAYINSTWNHVVAHIAAQRHLTPQRVNQIADSLTGMMPQQAFANGLIDTLCFAQNIKTLLKEQYDVEHIISANRYAKDVEPDQHDQHIAIIYAEGDVVPGSSDDKSYNTTTAVYGDDIVKAFHEAARDEDVKAIVLRVNSPGGAVTASESMTHAIREAKKVKPVIVSMSGLAASAGYEISCFGTCIVAHPTTLTGSIGVFATVPEVGTLLRKHLGLSTDTVMTNANSTGLSFSRPLSPAARAMMQRNVEDFYVTFVQRVADGRHMKWDEVNQIARGRVWTGAQAKEIGLVDTLGGLPLALRIAAQKANIEPGTYDIVTYPRQRDIWTQLFDFGTSHHEEEVTARISQLVPFYTTLLQWSHMEPLQARLPFELHID